MNPLQLSAEGVNEMKSFYQDELNKTLRRLEHINDILLQLGAQGTAVEMQFSDASSKKTGRFSNTSLKRKYRKKRGPKSKWDKIVLKTIESAGRPLTYDEITNYVMISEGREPSKLKNTKASVQNTVFRLRKENKASTFGMGARTKYIAPIKWFTPEGEIEPDYKAKVKAPKKKDSEKKKSTRGPGRPRKTNRLKTVPAVKRPKAKGAAKPVKKTSSVSTRKAKAGTVKKKAGGKKAPTVSKRKATLKKGAKRKIAMKKVVK